MDEERRNNFLKVLAVVTVFFLSFFLTSFSSITDYSIIANIQRAFPEKVTPESIKENYKQKPIRVLLVPGHDNEYGGAEFAGMKESDLALETAKYLYEHFKYNPRFSIILTRDLSTGEYTEIFKEYFEKNKEDIKKFIDEKAVTMEKFLETGLVSENNSTSHKKASNNVRERLYGINKWANENSIDIALHIHFNDYPGRKFNRAGKYSGFSVYVPELQLPNGRVSKEIGQSVVEELDMVFNKSDLPMEKDTLIETQELIAIGSRGSRDGASVLVEYGYVYEPQFSDWYTRSIALKEMTYRTYRAISGYFDKEASVKLPVTSILPFVSDVPNIESKDSSADVLKWQITLSINGLYPPNGKTENDCPLTGIFGPCTKTAIENMFSQIKN